MVAQESFRDWFNQLLSGDEFVAVDFDRRYTRPLLAFARSRLGIWIRDRVDPDDVVQSVYRSFFRRHVQKEVSVANWDSLWSLLSLMTLRKCAEQARRHQAPCRDCRRDIELPDILPSHEPTPAEVVVLTDLVSLLLRGWKPHEQAALELHLQGHTLDEISARIGRARRTVQTILQRARKRLRRMLEGPYLPHPRTAS